MFFRIDIVCLQNRWSGINMESCFLSELITHPPPHTPNAIQFWQLSIYSGERLFHILYSADCLGSNSMSSIVVMKCFLSIICSWQIPMSPLGAMAICRPPAALQSNKQGCLCLNTSSLRLVRFSVMLLSDSVRYAVVTKSAALSS